ncbi:MAG: YgiQ family radical SAM protein [Ruminococcaceae bacterium]|nr:YgiQ family radical SAM protein [Oscillospiraceae bacterium]
MSNFLPITAEDAKQRGWEYVDFVYVTGDAYVDHPSFGVSIISRVLEAKGYKVGIISQPDWNNNQAFKIFGRPRLGFFVTSGNIDSMVAHYTAAKKKRSDDAYTPGGKAGKRPDRAVIVYCKKIREIYPDSPIIIGGLEASLRRFAHYDYWADEVKPSILVESGADLLSFGMGENQTIEIAERLKSGESIKTMTDIKGTCCLVDTKDTPYTGVECPSYKNVVNSKREYAIATRIQLDEQDHIRGKMIKQRHGDKMLIQNEPMPPLTTEELDWVYSLPYERNYHPSYEEMGGVPGIAEVKFSITHNRGCFGACNFCSLAFHQGRFITTRSKESIIEEAKKLTELEDFKGYIHDVGGPTANFRRPACDKQLEHGLCKGKKCLAPKPCSQLISNHEEYLNILRDLRKLPKVKKVFIRSGIRFDYLLEDKDKTFFRELVEHHTSGQLKVAPEHCSASVLDYMGKPHIEAYLKFAKEYFAINKKIGKEQYLVPYLMSSHPGSMLDDAIALALFLKKEHIKPEQVQDFYPTPGTVSTCMFYTELDPYTLKEVYVAKNPHDKALQRALLQSYNPKNRALVEEALKKAKRFDLIGQGEKCLIKGKVQPVFNNKKNCKPVKNNGRKKRNK